MTDSEQVKRDLEARLEVLRKRVSHIKRDLGEPADPVHESRSYEIAWCVRQCKQQRVHVHIF